MRDKFEILAPGGDIDCIKAAIVAGAGAVYCGLEKFNARTSAANISYDELIGIIGLAHKHNCQIFLTLNIIILEQELSDLIRLLNRLVNTSLDAVIVQDLGLFYLLSKYFKKLVVHASTQTTTHNVGQIDFLNQLGIDRVNLARELDIDEVKALTQYAHQKDIEVEVFVHGSYCIGFSGLCYLSSVQSGNSGNRGRCSQPCRDQFLTTSVGRNFPLNLKDNSAFYDLKEIAEAQVDSLKIEGRIKKADYVYTTVNSWKKQIAHFRESGDLLTDNNELYKVFNRDFTNGFLKGKLSQSMFIDNPRSHTVPYFSATSDKSIEEVKHQLFCEKNKSMDSIRKKIGELKISKTPLSLVVSGKLGTSLTVSVFTPDNTYIVNSKQKLIKGGKYSIDRESIAKRFSTLNNFEFSIVSMDLDGLDPSLFVSFKEQTALRNRITCLLNGGVKPIPAVEIPKLKGLKKKHKTKLSVLTSCLDDAKLALTFTDEVYFEICDAAYNEFDSLLNLFKENKKLIPWFPSILIGKDYQAAVNLLEELMPGRIVSNNTGIASHASKLGLDWIAGPHINCVNSYSLKCLKEEYNCSGAFISNEIKKKQIEWIKSPEGFELHYSVFHPNLLMTSRQCLFLTTSGCQKGVFDIDCLHSCDKSTSITNILGESFIIDKRRGHYNSLYSSFHYLNRDVLRDLPNYFYHVMIDLRDISTATHLPENKSKIIQSFQNLLNGDLSACDGVRPISCNQYFKGL